MDTVIERVREFAESLLPAMGLELFDVQFRREGHGWVLRLVVDREEGVTLDDFLFTRPKSALLVDANEQP